MVILIGFLACFILIALVWLHLMWQYIKLYDSLNETDKNVNECCESLLKGSMEIMEVSHAIKRLNKVLEKVIKNESNDNI